jgi:dTDP-L-rhamnose 4-epimerase
VLVTGGAGFIGTALCRALVAHGAQVTAVDNLHPQVHPSGRWPDDHPDGVTRVTADVTDADAWPGILETAAPDVVVHLAAETGTGQSLLESSRHASVNVLGTARMVDALARSGRLPSQVVLASSRAVYGEGRWAASSGLEFYPPSRDAGQLGRGQWDPVAPDGSGGARPLPHRGATTEPRPSSVYAATKLAQEHLLRAWCDAMGPRLAVFRFQNVYGPGQAPWNPYTGIVTLFVRLGLAGRTASVYEDGAILRDFVYVTDVVDAVVAAIRADAVPRTAIDVGSGRPTTLLEVARLVARLTGAPEPKVTGEFRAGDVRAAAADLTDAGHYLGYAPRVGLEQGLRDVVAWIRAVDA